MGICGQLRQHLTNARRYFQDMFYFGGKKRSRSSFRKHRDTIGWVGRLTNDPLPLPYIVFFEWTAQVQHVADEGGNGLHAPARPARLRALRRAFSPRWCWCQDHHNSNIFTNSKTSASILQKISNKYLENLLQKVDHLNLPLVSLFHVRPAR